AWEGNGSGDDHGIFAQRYSSSGSAQSGEFLVNTTTTGTQDSASVTMDNSGSFMVVWMSANTLGSEDIVGQQYDASGVRMGSEFRVTTTSASSLDGAMVEMDSMGHAVIAWSGSGSGDSQGVYAERFNVGGGSGMSYMKLDQFDPNGD